MTDPRTDLENVQIPEPCNADWAAMLGSERRRYCDQCQLHVHNVAAMPRDEAEALIARRDEGEKVCVRLEYEPDGTCVTAEAPKEPSPQKATALALALGTGLLAACRSDEPRAPEEPQPIESSNVENASVESGEAVRIGQVLQGSLEAPLTDEGCEAMGESEPPQQILMGRISLTGEVTVNSDGQLTDPEGAESATNPSPAPLQPTIGEVAPLATEHETDSASAGGQTIDHTIMGGAGDPVPAQAGPDGSPKRPVMMGTPGPSRPKDTGGHASPTETNEASSDSGTEEEGVAPPSKSGASGASESDANEGVDELDLARLMKPLPPPKGSVILGSPSGKHRRGLGPQRPLELPRPPFGD